MEGIESEGKTVAEAVDNALRRLGLRRDQVEVQILQESAPGFLGMGAKLARVRIQEKRWGEGLPEPSPVPRASAPPRQPILAAEETAPAPVDPAMACTEATSLIKQLCSLMTMNPGDLTVTWDSIQERVVCRLNGRDAEQLIGSDGRTLEALQFLATLMVGRKVGAPVAVQVDALGYWDKREKDVLAQAQRAVADVRSTGKPFRLSPMDAPMRRLIHRNLAGHPDVETSSEGEGAWRKIVIRPRKR